MPHPKGGYKLPNGDRVPGTTTIIKRFQESGGLMVWAFNQGRDGAETLYEQREEAAEVGKVAHAMVEQHVKGLTFADTLQDFSAIPTPLMGKAQKAFNAFKTWERQTSLKIVATEESMTCGCHRFGGTLDAIGQIDNQLCLIDFKTSNAIYQDMLYQLAAYRHLWEINHPDLLLTGGFHLIRFSKTAGDFAHHFFDELDEAWRGFELMRPLFDIDKSLKKRAA
jgi:hypothetical protein